jgi:hypothetical protein
VKINDRIGLYQREARIATRVLWGKQSAA